MTTVFNYIIVSGIRSAVYKSGKRNIADDYRGITILTIMGKIHELVVH